MYVTNINVLPQHQKIVCLFLKRTVNSDIVHSLDGSVSANASLAVQLSARMKTYYIYSCNLYVT